MPKRTSDLDTQLYLCVGEAEEAQLPRCGW
jgi:hypothetical protein